MHPRQKIRNRIKELLVDIEATNNIFTSLADSLNEDQLPAIVIRTESDNVKQSTYGAELRSVSVGIEICVIANDNFNDIIDDLALEIEKKLKTNNNLQNYWQKLELKNTDIKIDNEGLINIASAVLNYSVLYNN